VIDDETRERLAQVHDDARLTEAEERMRTGWYAAGPYACLECRDGIRKPRLLKDASGRRFVTLSWCGQGCLDKWRGRLRVPGTRWEKYDQDGVLIGFVVPRRGFIPIEDVEEASA